MCVWWKSGQKCILNFKHGNIKLLCIRPWNGSIKRFNIFRNKKNWAECHLKQLLRQKNFSDNQDIQNCPDCQKCPDFVGVFSYGCPDFPLWVSSHTHTHNTHRQKHTHCLLVCWISQQVLARLFWNFKITFIGSICRSSSKMSIVQSKMTDWRPSWIFGGKNVSR